MRTFLKVIGWFCLLCALSGGKTLFEMMRSGAPAEKTAASVAAMFLFILAGAFCLVKSNQTNGKR